MKKLILVWTLVIAAIIGGLTIIGLKIKERTIDNLNEQAIKTKAEEYLNLYVGNYPTKGNKITLTLDDLINYGYDPMLEEGCTGYVVVENKDMGYTFAPYIKCPDYITEGYDK